MFSIAICDDEIKEVEAIRTIVEDFMKEHVIIYKLNTYCSGGDLIASNERFDFVFLDIAMKEMDGIETGMKLYQRNRKIQIVYITSFHEYCNKAVNNTHAFAYLLKPIKKEELLKQVSELIKIIGIDRGNEIEIELSNVTEIKGDERKEYVAIKMPVSKILYFEYIKANRKIRVKMGDKIYEYSSRMADVEEKMEIYGFGTCCRGILVNLEHVTKVKGDTVYLNNGEKLSLSQKRVAAFKKQITDYVHRSI